MPAEWEAGGREVVEMAAQGAQGGTADLEKESMKWRSCSSGLVMGETVTIASYRLGEVELDDIQAQRAGGQPKPQKSLWSGPLA